MNTRKAYLSKFAGRALTEYLTSKGFDTVPLTGIASDGRPSPVYEAVSTHADIHMCRLGLWKNPRIFMGNVSRLGRNYPGNIIYNAVCTGKYFLHNLKYTDRELMKAAQEWHEESFPGKTLHIISVPQGYTRCCCLPVDDSSFITSDEGIAKALEDTDAQVLLIQKGHIKLPGFNYGFIGGCAGHLTLGSPEKSSSSVGDMSAMSPVRRVIVFNGDLSAHPDFHRMMAFIEDNGGEAVYFHDFPLTDIGSILTE